jgi:hypothetical protein
VARGAAKGNPTLSAQMLKAARSMVDEIMRGGARNGAADGG